MLSASLKVTVCVYLYKICIKRSLGLCSISKLRFCGFIYHPTFSGIRTGISTGALAKIPKILWVKAG
jgi:hypothetical protein